MNYCKNPILKFCFWYLWMTACKMNHQYYKKEMKNDIRSIEHKLNVLDDKRWTKEGYKTYQKRKAIGEKCR